MSQLLDGRVAIVTGAGRGLGRAHALELARQGARVVVNDLGAAPGASDHPAHRVAQEIRDLGGEAVVDGADVADWDGARQLVACAIESFGRLDALVNNAGFVRDRMFASMSEQEWDDVVRVHLKGHAATMRHAVDYWRGQAKAGAPVAARVVNTSSGAGLLGSVGQSNYVAGKAGVLGLTVTAAQELGRYGITVNAIAPVARTPMTESVFADMMAVPEGGFDAMAPENVSPMVAWLAGPDSGHVTGRVFEVQGGQICLMTAWQHGPVADRGARWAVQEIGAAVNDLITKAPAPEPVYGA
jgi:NAD(P)-dependent dehydrogenase (short-subunit alcohol dehydrogenase family)